MPEIITEQPHGNTTPTTQVNVPNQKPFECFPATNYTSKVCIDCLDRPLMKDDQCEVCNYRGEPLCAHCSCFWFPFAFTLDIVSFPYRGIKHCVSK